MIFIKAFTTEFWPLSFNFGNFTAVGAKILQIGIFPKECLHKRPKF